MADAWICNCATSRRPDATACPRCGPRCVSLNRMEEVRCHRCGRRRPGTKLSSVLLARSALILPVFGIILLARTGLEIAGVPITPLVVVLLVAAVLLAGGTIGIVWVSLARWTSPATRRPSPWLPFGVGLVGTAPLLAGVLWGVVTFPGQPAAEPMAVRVWTSLSIGWLAIGVPLAGLLCWIVSTEAGSGARGFVTGVAGVLIVGLVTVLITHEAGPAGTIDLWLVVRFLIAPVCAFAAGHVLLRFLYRRIVYMLVPPTG